MTATPIPRTLLLTHYGDLDVSKLTEKPAGRKPITTVAIPTERMEEVIDGLKRALQAGAQIYWVCPLVEDTGKSELAAAEERAAHLRQFFGDGTVGIVHGQMAGAAKDQVMAAFSSGALKLLVATTVIEVGVNVPNATVMVIEHAERFGLAQLHQLRGRVGRGDRQSSCILLYQGPVGEVAKARLEMMRVDRGRLCHRRGGFAAARRWRGDGHAPERHAGVPRRQCAELFGLAAHRP